MWADCEKHKAGVCYAVPTVQQGDLHKPLTYFIVKNQEVRNSLSDYVLIIVGGDENKHHIMSLHKHVALGIESDSK